MTFRYHFQLALFCLLVIVACCLQIAFAFAEDTGAGGSGLYPFHLPQHVQDLPACKYVDRRLGGMRTSESYPLMFANVTGIYLLSWRIDNGISDLKKIPFLDQKEISTLAACVLPNRPGQPIYILDRWPVHGELDTWSEAKKDGNLIISVQVEIEDGSGLFSYQNLFNEKLVLLHARYFRHGVNDFRSAQEQCTTAFPYSENSETLQKLLTLAMRKCLSKPYGSVALSPSQKEPCSQAP